jgi:hypothetical protein
VARLAALPVEAAYLTHFGRVTGVPRLGQSLREQIEACVAITRRHASSDQRQQLIRTDLRQLWIDRAQEHGIPNAAARIDEILGPDLELNTQGLLAWLDREQRQRPR